MMAERVFLLIGIAGVLALGAFSLLHHDYYLLSALERPTHADHARLRSSGALGLAFGLAGTTAFSLNLGYLLRKRFARSRWMGSLRAWMGFHVATGVLGAALILAHSAYLPRSALGVLSSIALAIVVGTGLLGRYLYALVPRSLSGRELGQEELRQSLEADRTELVAAGFDASLLDRHVVDPGLARRGLLARIARVIGGDRAIRRSVRQLRREPISPALLPLVRRFARDQQWLARYAEARALLGAWRFLHRWLAISMLAVVSCHVWVAVRFGDLVWPWEALR